MLTFANPGCTWVPEGPGNVCWRVEGPVTLISCAAGPAISYGCAVGTASETLEKACVGGASALKLFAHSLFGFLRGCTWAGSVELEGFAQRPYCMTVAFAGGALLALAFLAGGGEEHSSLFAPVIGLIDVGSANSS